MSFSQKTNALIVPLLDCMIQSLSVCQPVCPVPELVVAPSYVNSKGGEFSNGIRCQALALQFAYEIAVIISLMIEEVNFIAASAHFEHGR